MRSVAQIRQLISRQARRPVELLPKPHPLADLQTTYFSHLLHLVVHPAYLEVQRIMPHVRALGASKHDGVRMDDWTDEINRLFENLKTASDKAKKIAKDLALNTLHGVNTRNRTNFLRTMKAALAVDVFDNADTKAIGKLFVQQNVSLITSIPTKYFDDVEGVVLRNFQAGNRAEDFQDDIEERFSVTENRAALIARDQISKLNGALTRERQTSIGIEGYYWRTSEDERVRDTHAENNGQRFEWDNPPEETGHPGEDINCRCHADPDVSGIFDEDEIDDS